MNIEILVSVDGEQLPLNEELNTTISNLVNSYIKLKITGVKLKVAKVRVPRDPNAPKREARPHLTEQEIETVVTRAAHLQDRTLTKASQIIAEEIGRSWTTIYGRLQKLVKRGELKFAESTYNMPKVNLYKKIIN